MVILVFGIIHFHQWCGSKFPIWIMGVAATNLTGNSEKSKLSPHFIHLVPGSCWYTTVMGWYKSLPSSKELTYIAFSMSFPSSFAFSNSLSGELCETLTVWKSAVWLSFPFQRRRNCTKWVCSTSGINAKSLIHKERLYVIKRSSSSCSFSELLQSHLPAACLNWDSVVH